MKKIKIVVFILIVLIGILGWTYLLLNQKGGELKRVKINGVEIIVEISDTEEKRKKGLSFRENLGERQGMLFLFENFDFHPFWMKNMKFPLDFIWIAGNEIVDIRENIPPDYSDILYPSLPVDKVLEVRAGFVKKYEIQKGQKIEILD